MRVSTYNFKKPLPEEYQKILPPPQVFQNEIRRWEEKQLQKTQTLFPEEREDHKKKVSANSTKSMTLPNTQKTLLSLKPRQIRFLKSAKIGDKVTSFQYAKKMGISSPTALRDLKDLTEKGYLKRFGKRKKVYFEVVQTMQ